MEWLNSIDIHLFQLINDGGFEQMEFDTGAGSSTVVAQLTGAGVAHNYVAFVNIGDAV